MLRLALALLLLACSALARAELVTLSWDASAGADGYRVYCGASTGTYDPTPLYEGAATSAQINITQERYCAVTAYNGSGESTYSNEIRILGPPSFTIIGTR